MTAAAIPLAGVLGTAVAHSASPRLHAHWLRRHAIRGHYVPLQVAAADLAQVVAAMPRMGFVGGNVTIPHKERILELADTVSEHAGRIGAANTLVFGAEGSLHADNTDGAGFVANLRQGAPDWSAADGPAAILGAGGAARAIIVALLDAGVPEIRLSNRTRARAEALRAEFGPSINVHEWGDGAATLSDVRLVVQTTSLGMTGKDPFDLRLDALAPDAVAADLVYEPLDTGFLKAARVRGCRTVDGLGMLLHQAVPGFEAWFGVRPDVDAATRAAVIGS